LFWLQFRFAILYLGLLLDFKEIVRLGGFSELIVLLLECEGLLSDQFVEVDPNIIDNNIDDHGKVLPKNV